MPTLHQPKINFTQVSNSVLFDRNVSLKAKGLYSYLRAKPDNYQFSAERIAFETSDGVRSIWSGMQELEDSKYIYRHRTSTGHFDYFIFNNPLECEGFIVSNNIKTKIKKTIKEDLNSSNKPNIQNSSKAQSGVNPPNIQNSRQLKQQTAKTAVINNTELINNTEKKTTTVPEVVVDVEKILKEFQEIGFSQKQIIDFSSKYGFSRMELVLIEFSFSKKSIKHPIGWIIRALDTFDLTRAEGIKKSQIEQNEQEKLEEEIQQKQEKDEEQVKRLEKIEADKRKTWIKNNSEKYVKCIQKAYNKALENKFYSQTIRTRAIEAGMSEIEYFKKSPFYTHLINVEIELEQEISVPLFA